MEKKDRLNKLIEKYAASHPFYDKTGCRNYSEKILSEICPELEPVLDTWLLNGMEANYTHNKYSIYMIMDLRDLCYIDALELLNIYIKDPIDGEARILPY